MSDAPPGLPPSPKESLPGPALASRASGFGVVSAAFGLSCGRSFGCKSILASGGGGWTGGGGGGGGGGASTSFNVTTSITCLLEPELIVAIQRKTP